MGGTAGADLERLARSFFGAYGHGDLATMRSLLADGAVTDSDEFWS